MLTAKRKKGRLVIIRMQSPVTKEEVGQFETELRMGVLAVPVPVIFFADMRRIQVLPEEVVDFVVGTMRRLNPQLVRTALLLPHEGAIVGMQIQRMIREAGNPLRRTFRDQNEAIAWLSEIMTLEEKGSLLSYLEDEEGL